MLRAYPAEILHRVCGKWKNLYARAPYAIFNLQGILRRLISIDSSQYLANSESTCA
jgi:hypothetical protein